MLRVTLLLDASLQFYTDRQHLQGLRTQTQQISSGFLLLDPLREAVSPLLSTCSSFKRTGKMILKCDSKLKEQSRPLSKFN